MVVPVNPGALAYRIIVSSGGLLNVGRELAQLRVGRRAALVSDPAILELHGAPVREGMKTAGFDVTDIVLPVGEEAKTLDVARRVWDLLLEAGCDRTSTVGALGGGAGGGLPGFPAGPDLRGGHFLQVPT